MSNITVTVVEPTVSVTEVVSNIAVVDLDSNTVTSIPTTTSNVSVTSTISNVVLSPIAIASTAQIRQSLSNVAPILYDANTGVIGIDTDAVFSNALANAWFTTQTTNNLAEGNINLYFTTDRANSAIALYDGNINTTGNITAAYFIGDGSQLTGLPEAYGNANVVSLLSNYSNVINSNANITTTANISGDYLFGNGSFLTNVGITESQFITLLQKYKGLINVVDGGTANNQYDGGANSTPTFNDTLDGGSAAA